MTNARRYQGRHGRRRLTLYIFSNTFDPDFATARQTLVRATVDRALCR